MSNQGGRTMERQVGSRSARGTGASGGNRKGLLGLLAGLLLLGLLVLGALLLAYNVWDNNDEDGVDLADDEISADAADADDRSGDAASEGEGDGATSSTAAPDDAQGSPGAAGEAGSLTSGGEALLPPPAGGLQPYADQPVEAQSVPVQSVVADEGFWVGTSETDRVFVFFAADNAGTESPVQVEAGRPVTFTGTVRTIPGDYQSTFEIDEGEGAAQLGEQGHYVEVPPNAIQQG